MNSQFCDHNNLGEEGQTEEPDLVRVLWETKGRAENEAALCPPRRSDVFGRQEVATFQDRFRVERSCIQKMSRFLGEATYSSE